MHSSHPGFDRFLKDDGGIARSTELNLPGQCPLAGRNRIDDDPSSYKRVMRFYVLPFLHGFSFTTKRDKSHDFQTPKAILVLSGQEN